MRLPAKLALLLLAALGLGACSQDKHVFKSTIHLPVNVEVYDTASDQVLWRKEVPVGQKLVLDFDRPLEIEPMWANMQPAKLMQWRMYRDDETLNLEERYKWKEAHVVHLPGTPILLRRSYRPAPEYPPGYTPPDMSATQPEPTLEEVPEAAPVESAEPAEPMTAEEAPPTDPTLEAPESTEPVVPETMEPILTPAPEVDTTPEPAPAPEMSPAPTPEPELPTLD